MSLARSLDAGRIKPPHPGGTATAGLSAAAGAIARLDSIDLLRGLVMILMALDHTRDFFGSSGPNPRDVADPALFLTRWITHYCAPVFIFLAGISAWLYGAKGRTTAEVSRFLLTRGFWLIVLEFTIVRIGWTFNPGFSSLMAGVIWAIGASMIVLAGLVWLPRAAIAGFGLALIAGHNLLDSAVPADLGSAGWLWTILHEGGNIQLGLVLLRASNLYGDPDAWTAQENWVSTVLSFINCEKYPPSLLYLMMTIGPALLLLAAFEGVRGRLAGWITIYGRVPLIYYVAHIYLLHLLALVMVLIVYWNDLSWITASPPQKPADYGFALPGVYAMWLAVVIMLYPLVRWFAALKARSRAWWLSYL